MEGGTWTFQIVDRTGKEIIGGGVNSELGSGVGKKSGKTSNDKGGFGEAFRDKVFEDTIKDTVISPLNTVTGGLARPIYRTAKRLSSGGNAGVALGDLAGTLAIMAVQKGIEHLQNRVKEVENKIKDLNDTDNVLIRSGAVSKATYYEGNIFGIKKLTNRS